MAVISEIEEHDHNNSTAPSKKTFNAVLDPLNPLGFLEKAFEFVSKVTDLFKSEDENVVVRMVKDKVKIERNCAAEKNVKGVPNKDNGLDMDKYRWGQSLQEVDITIPVPAGTKSRFITYEIKKNHLKVGLKGQPPVLDAELFNTVKADDCFWILVDRKYISILLTKQNQMKWWRYLVKGEPEINTEKLKPEKSNLAGLDREMDSAVVSAMFDFGELDF
ncbi:Nuclear distribution protein NUDC [Handroanthus impetiginosus]|uniref:Nuclear distribution protein NUDC n=1 Tax=Handroanthus impetiginosus TaxID=429701 RepID=A0A2G9GBG9_9LAMI|nr:Nuclear distribution protein NUDC [Handroanthus impetiginosus]